MNRRFILLMVLNISLFCIFGQGVENIKTTIDTVYADLNDGPYIFINKNQLVQKDIVNGEMVVKRLEGLVYDTVYKPQESVFTNVEKIAVLSDLHGQLQLTLDLLKNNKIIDSELNWSFGKGHLVIVGDIFDRGDKVNELLWLVYSLEYEAKKQGGNVHFLMGNHEYMVLLKDLRYIHKKYKHVSNVLNVSYEELYNEQTILGRWLYSKPTIVKINDNIFVHAGISKEFLSSTDFDIEAINNTMRKAMKQSKEELKSTGIYSTFLGSTGLIWYREYFKEDFDEEAISHVLKQTKSEHIIVGHTSQNQIVQLFGGKVFGVDSSIKNGEYGELLFIIDNQYFRGTKDGNILNF